MTENEFKQLFGWMEHNPTWSREFTAINEMRLKLERAQSALAEVEHLAATIENAWYRQWCERHAAALEATREEQ